MVEGDIDVSLRSSQRTGLWSHAPSQGGSTLAFLNNPTLPGTGCFWFAVAVKRLSHQTNKWTAEPANTPWLEKTCALAQLQTSQWGGREEGWRWLIDCNVRVSTLALTALNVSWHHKWDQRRTNRLGWKLSGGTREQWGTAGAPLKSRRLPEDAFAPIAGESSPWLSPSVLCIFYLIKRILM